MNKVKLHKQHLIKEKRSAKRRTDKGVVEHVYAPKKKVKIKKKVFENITPTETLKMRMGLI